MSHIVPWMKCVVKTSRADSKVRKYFDLPLRPYKVEFNPQISKQEKILNDKTTVVKEIGGNATKKGVTYPQVPQLYQAQHEVVHVQHLLNNPSLKNIDEIYKDPDKRLLATMALELIANGFVSRDGVPEQWRVASYKSNKKIFEVSDEAINYFDSLAQKRENFENYTALNEATDLEALKEAYWKTEEQAYSIGTEVGRWLFTDWTAEQPFSINVEVHEEKVEGTISYKTSSIDPTTRKALLNDLFFRDYEEVAGYANAVYSQSLAPLLQKGYEELSCKVKEKLKK